MKKCSNCNSQNADTAKFCNICGYKLDDVKNLCPRCKKEIEPNKQFCRHCGANLSKKTSTNKKLKVLLSTLIGLLIVIAISFTAYYFLSKYLLIKETSDTTATESSKAEESKPLASDESKSSAEESTENKIDVSNYVYDYAGIIDSEYTDKIDVLISDLKEKSSIEIYVVTTNSIGGKTLDNYISDLFTDLGLDKNSDELSLLVIALEENICRIEAGKNLSNFVSSDTLKEILDQYAIPELNVGKFGSGTYTALSEIVRKIYDLQSGAVTSTESLTESASSTETTESTSTYTPQELIIDSRNKEGIKVKIPEKGLYKFSIIEGAYTVYQKELNKGWLTILSIFINKPLEFEDTEYGPYPINEDGIIGSEALKATYNEAENSGKGSSTVKALEKNDYVILIISDSYYEDNSGSIKVRIEKYD